MNGDDRDSQDEPMSADLVASLGAVVSSATTGLPAPITQGVIGSISRLIAGATDIGTAWLASKREKIEDAAYEKRLARRGLGQAAVIKGMHDNDLLDRTLERILNEQVGKQRNRESVARYMLEHVAETASKNTDQVVPEPVDEDWMGKFTAQAEGTSKEEAQRLWAKVLARETFAPGSVSIRTLEVIGRLDRTGAERFAKLASLTIGNVLPADVVGDGGPIFSDVRLAIDDGLISPTKLAKSLRLPSGVPNGHLSGRGWFLQLFGPHADQARFDAYFLTQAGIELADIIAPEGEEKAILDLVTRLPKHGLDCAVLWRFKPNTREILPDLRSVWSTSGTDREMLEWLPRQLRRPQ